MIAMGCIRRILNIWSIDDCVPLFNNRTVAGGIRLPHSQLGVGKCRSKTALDLGRTPRKLKTLEKAAQKLSDIHANNVFKYNIPLDISYYSFHGMQPAIRCRIRMNLRVSPKETGQIVFVFNN